MSNTVGCGKLFKRKLNAKIELLAGGLLCLIKNNYLSSLEDIHPLDKEISFSVPSRFHYCLKYSLNFKLKYF